MKRARFGYKEIIQVTEWVRNNRERLLSGQHTRQEIVDKIHQDTGLTLLPGKMSLIFKSMDFKPKWKATNMAGLQSPVIILYKKVHTLADVLIGLLRDLGRPVPQELVDCLPASTRNGEAE